MKGYHSLPPILCSVLQPFSFLSRVKEPHSSAGEPGEALEKSPREERVKLSDAEQDKEASSLQTSAEWSLPLLGSWGTAEH